MIFIFSSGNIQIQFYTIFLSVYFVMVRLTIPLKTYMGLLPSHILPFAPDSSGLGGNEDEEVEESADKLQLE